MLYEHDDDARVQCGVSLGMCVRVQKSCVPNTVLLDPDTATRHICRRPVSAH